ncbi:hypothetical protein TRFO_34505 [Tritrichomonas foetus]|uniref:TPR Domain containing protein n=1 Tax=Tritrichomonas foetus TaxID=1144522 RepID=A0A1J4JKI7_9EUKA|nr:hypothetical protein TRFO_34505 [Tritrichomonas foetus]|eukprot:OHS99145.1 hypothetical protein TRFO_34505 [Tritrichomonas foetus]
MKSEVEQFNKLQFPPPLKTFSPINFKLADERPTLSYSQASLISFESVSYFEVGNPISEQIRARFKVEDPITLRDYIPQPYLETEQDIANVSYPNNSDEQRKIIFTKQVGGHLRRREYEPVVSLMAKIQSHLQYSGILPLYAFISAIICDDDANEFNFFQYIEENFVQSIFDFPHYNHVLDEIFLLSKKGNYPTPLLDISVPDVFTLKNMLQKRVHIIPSFQFHTNFFHFQDRILGITQTFNSIRTKLPPLLPVGEGFHGITNDQKPLPINFSMKNRSKNSKARSRTPVKSRESSDVLSLISKSKWSEAVALATEALSKSPNDTEMYLHRAFALYHIEKMEDALNDCTLSISIKRTDKALRMRASFWLLLGEADLCMEDLLMMDDKSLYQSVVKQNIQKMQANNNNNNNNNNNSGNSGSGGLSSSGQGGSGNTGGAGQQGGNRGKKCSHNGRH